MLSRQPENVYVNLKGTTAVKAAAGVDHHYEALLSELALIYRFSLPTVLQYAELIINFFLAQSSMLFGVNKLLSN